MNKVRKRAIKLSLKQKIDELKDVSITNYIVAFTLFLPIGLFLLIIAIGDIFLGTLETALTGKETFTYSYITVDWDMEAIEQIENERLSIECKHCYLKRI